MEQRLFRVLAAAFMAASALIAALPLGCGSQTVGRNTAGATKDSSVRSTEIVHEPCDIESKDAVKTDVNGDGKPDIISVTSGGRDVCRAVDLDFDGKFDMFVYFDANGKVRRTEFDFDGNGAIEEIDTYQGGVLVGKESDTNADGKLDTWDTFVNGKLVKRERDTNADGRVDQWWEFPNPDRLDCPVIAIDQDGDGRPDITQDVCKENQGDKEQPTQVPSASPPSSAPAATPAPTGSAPPAASGSAAAAPKGGTP